MLCIYNIIQLSIRTGLGWHKADINANFKSQCWASAAYPCQLSLEEHTVLALAPSGLPRIDVLEVVVSVFMWTDAGAAL